MKDLLKEFREAFVADQSLVRVNLLVCLLGLVAIAVNTFGGF